MPPRNALGGATAAATTATVRKTPNTTRPGWGPSMDPTISASPTTARSPGRISAAWTSMRPATSRIHATPAPIRTIPAVVAPEWYRRRGGGSLWGISARCIVSTSTAPPRIHEPETGGDQHEGPHQAIEPGEEGVEQEHESRCHHHHPQDEGAVGHRRRAPPSQILALGLFGNDEPGHEIDEKPGSPTHRQHHERQTEPHRVDPEVVAEAAAHTGDHSVLATPAELGYRFPSRSLLCRWRARSKLRHRQPPFESSIRLDHPPSQCRRSLGPGTEGT